MKTLGICFGASTVTIVELFSENGDTSVQNSWRISHEGNPRSAFLQWFSSYDNTQLHRVAVTGRLLRENVLAQNISEPQAIELALPWVCKNKPFPSVLVSCGGETQIAYKIGVNGTITSVHSGNKCASGTGEFFLQQIRRMGLTLEDAVSLALKGTPHRIAGRCSVFCKSDCTHALNLGESKENVIAGLCAMMAEKIVELIKDLPISLLGVIGGGSCNSAMIGYLIEKYKKVEVLEHATVFEALGAALWANKHESSQCTIDPNTFFISSQSSFSVHKPLQSAHDFVRFCEAEQKQLVPHDTCVIGLDVGSTTTKALLMRCSDSAILSSVYLRTSGNPIAASVACYKALALAIGSVPVKIMGLGVTGSGRQIAALHANTKSVINEIIAHAAAAYFYDTQVDTIFEIGGQDAKYTLLTNGVPSDYAMNEACSAGTGSFLEEAAFETLSVPTTEIGALALQGMFPPNFSDQCAAFIASDIKRATQEKIERNDILAGLIYSICLNYLNRVKGNRPLGKKVFMQGGVCYNKAVPMAMASLMNCEIIVPPNPGLMGALGVALETARRIKEGITSAGDFDINELIRTNVSLEGSFDCKGSGTSCDRKCSINTYRINGQLYPFGGACNKYYNVRNQITVDADTKDLVAVRHNLVFKQFGIQGYHPAALIQRDKSVGISRSFLAHSLYPLYSQFFGYLGFKIILSDEIDKSGMGRTLSSYCLPVEIAHGSFVNLLSHSPTYIFMPQVMQLPVPNVPTYSRLCVLVQGEPYYLSSTFREDIASSKTTLLRPVLRLEKGYASASSDFVSVAVSMGVEKSQAEKAYSFAVSMQVSCETALRLEGKKALAYLQDHPDEIGIVLFGRPYSAFTPDAHMGIPRKVSSRGNYVIPLDMLPADTYPVDEKMFWAMGQKIMKAAQFVKDHANLYGFYITNFSCGPDSFLLGFFRNLMGVKPSLTLELDQHTSDAGIDTRIEAALDIFRFRSRSIPKVIVAAAYNPARVVFDKELFVIDSKGNTLSINDPRVEIVLPSMGTYATEITAAVLRGKGINARALPVVDEAVFLTGRKNTSTKECLPYIITTGSFLHYLESDEKDTDKVTLLLMATGGGPCRLGQYCRALEQKIHELKYTNVAVLTITDENGYAGLGARTLLKAWQALLIADVFGDLLSMIKATAVDISYALQVLRSSWAQVIQYFEGQYSIRLTTLLSTMAVQLESIPRRKSPSDVPVIALVGEIFVRRDEFSRKNLVTYLESKGFMVRVAPVTEYPCYGNYVINKGLGERTFSVKEKVVMKLTAKIQEWWEWRIKSIFAQTHLYHSEMVDIPTTITGVGHLINENFRGECILTVGLALREIANSACGVISIGPFGCMPSKMAEAILKKEMNPEGKKRMDASVRTLHDWGALEMFPFFALETDGNAFPQAVTANLEAFVLKAHAMHLTMQDIKKTHHNHRKNKRHK